MRKNELNVWTYFYERIVVVVVAVKGHWRFVVVVVVVVDERLVCPRRLGQWDRIPPEREGAVVHVCSGGGSRSFVSADGVVGLLFIRHWHVSVRRRRRRRRRCCPRRSAAQVLPWRGHLVIHH